MRSHTCKMETLKMENGNADQSLWDRQTDYFINPLWTPGKLATSIKCLTTQLDSFNLRYFGQNITSSFLIQWHLQYLEFNAVSEQHIYVVQTNWSTSKNALHYQRKSCLFFFICWLKPEVPLGRNCKFFLLKNVVLCFILTHRDYLKLHSSMMQIFSIACAKVCDCF